MQQKKEAEDTVKQHNTTQNKQNDSGIQAKGLNGKPLRPIVAKQSGLPPIQAKSWSGAPLTPIQSQHSVVQRQVNQNASEGHGVTSAEANLQISDKKSRTVPPNTVVTILATEGGRYQVRVQIRGREVEGWLPQAAVNKTPDKLDDINTDTKHEVAIPTTNGVSVYPNYESPETPANLNIHAPGIPKALLPVFENQVKSMAGSRGVFSESNRSLNLKIDFSDLADNVRLSEAEANKYQGKTFVFRFTRFNNGNTQDVVLVEELGALQSQAPLSSSNKEELERKFNQYNFKFHEPTSQQLTNYSELAREVTSSDGALNERIQELYPNAFQALTDANKEQILRSVGRIPDSALRNITGVVFRRRELTIKDGEIYKLGGAYYSPDEHTITICEPQTSSDQVFGDKNSSSFANAQQKTITHELGHAVDHAPRLAADAEKDGSYATYRQLSEDYQALYTEYKAMSSGAERNQKAKELNEFKHNKLDPAKQAYQEKKTNYSNTSTLSGTRSELNNNTWRTVEDTTDFDNAVARDGNKITLYANESDQEGFAEAFALYITEPETLRTLSPNVYAYMLENFPQ